MKKIIHLSDLHVGYRHCQSHLNTVVNRIIFLKEPAQDYLIIITGDFVNDATQTGLYQAALVEINRLKTAGFQILICPGNHDYGTGSNGHKELVPTFKAAFLGSPSVTFPKLDIIGTTAFIGLDTMADELNWYDHLFAEGELGQNQLSALQQLLTTSEVNACHHRVVYLHHHPFDQRPFHGLKDKEKLEKILTGKIDCLLYGHNHDGHAANGKWSIPRCYDAGSTTRKNFDNPAKHSPIRIIDLTRSPSLDYDLGNPGIPI